MFRFRRGQGVPSSDHLIAGSSDHPPIATIGRSLYQLTEPIYRPIRRILPNFGGVDLSPLVVLVILFFLEQVIRTVLVPAVL